MSHVPPSRSSVTRSLCEYSDVPKGPSENWSVTSSVTTARTVDLGGRQHDAQRVGQVGLRHVREIAARRRGEQIRRAQVVSVDDRLDVLLRHTFRRLRVQDRALTTGCHDSGEHGKEEDAADTGGEEAVRARCHTSIVALRDARRQVWTSWSRRRGPRRAPPRQAYQGEAGRGRCTSDEGAVDRRPVGVALRARASPPVPQDVTDHERCRAEDRDADDDDEHQVRSAVQPPENRHDHRCYQRGCKQQDAGDPPGPVHVSRGSRAVPATGSGAAASTSSWTRSGGCARASHRRPCRSRRESSADRR